MTAADPDAETFAAFASFLGTTLPADPVEALRLLRRQAAATVEYLLAFLDATGADPDLEDGGDDEPGEDPEFSIGWAGHINQTSRHRLGELDQHFGDREQDRCDDEDGGDLEPSLGNWAPGYAIDAEDDPCDNEAGIEWTDSEAATGHYPHGSMAKLRGGKGVRRPT